MASTTPPPPPRRRRSWRWLLVPLLLLPLAGCGALLALALFSLGSGGRDLPERFWIELPLAGPLPEQRQPWYGLDWLAGEPALSMQELHFALGAAAADRRVEGVLLRPDGFAGGFAQAGEIAAQLGRLREAGKEVVAWMGQGGNLPYYLACQAQTVALAPEGVLELFGPRVEMVHLAEGLGQLGVDADFVAVGEYKSAPELFERREPSPAARRQVEAWMDALHDHWISSLSRSRGLTRERMLDLVDRGRFGPDEAWAEGLVDTLAADPWLGRGPGGGGAHPSGRVGIREYLEATTPLRGQAGAPAIAVLYATGTLVPGPGGEDPVAGELAGDEELLHRIAHAREDDSRAVVLRIDSPGGSATASDRLWRELRTLAAAKPLVVSMGNVAASGGYYIAMAGEEIYAMPTTLTGSIGVYAGKFDLSGLYDKLGLGLVPVSRGANASFPSSLQPFTEGQRQRLRADLEAFYGRFVERVAASRGLAPGEAEAVARGRVWAGTDALEHGLVDAAGGLHEAITRAAELAGIEPGSALAWRFYQPEPGWLELFLRDALRGGGDEHHRARVAQGSTPTPLRAALEALGPFARGVDGSPQFRLPWQLRPR